MVTLCTMAFPHSEIVRYTRRVHLCVLCGYQNKQQSFPCTALTDWCLGTLASSCLPVRPPLCMLSARFPTRRIFLKFDPGDLKRTKTSATLHEDLNAFYCCRRHKFATKALLRIAQYFYIVDSEMLLNDVQKGSPLRFHCNSGYANASQCYVVHTLQNL
jgi:hypothetical protein